MKYEVEIRQTIATTVEVEAPTMEEAALAADQRSFPLPPRDEWSSIKGSFEYDVKDAEGNWHEVKPGGMSWWFHIHPNGTCTAPDCTPDCNALHQPEEEETSP